MRQLLAPLQRATIIKRRLGEGDVADSAVTSIQVATLVVAGLAVVATLVSAWLLRRTGKGTVSAAQRAAAASERSADAAETSAKAAQDAVGVNAETAAGVAQRALADALAKRYQDAAEQLGHDRAAVRLAGVYAMGRLADDWPERRVECVEVLCAYLRMPWDLAEEEGEHQVRSAVLALIGEHVREGVGEGGWSEIGLDLSGATLPQFNYAKCAFRYIDLTGARFTGQSSFFHTTFQYFADFSRSHVQGQLYLGNTRVEGALYLDRVGVSIGGLLSLALEVLDDNAEVRADGMNVGGTVAVILRPQETGHVISLNGGTLNPKASLQIIGDRGRTDASAAWPKIKLHDWKVLSGARVELRGPEDLRDSIDWQPGLTVDGATIMI